MDPAYISAISALAGSVIGGLTTGFTTLVSQRSQARAGMVAHDLARREDLVRDFIIAASKTYGDAISNNEPKMPEIVDLYAMVNRLRVLGVTKTTACADIVMHTIVDTYFTPSRTVADLRELVRTGQGIDPLKDFSAAAREELHGSQSCDETAPVPLEGAIVSLNGGSEDTDLHFRAPNKYRAWRFDRG
jgi:hypothetical protein